MGQKRKLPDYMLMALDATGLPWRVEDGTRHKRVYLAGRLAVTLPRGNTPRDESTRQRHNNLAAIRRVARDAYQAGEGT